MKNKCKVKYFLIYYLFVIVCHGFSLIFLPCIIVAICMRLHSLLSVSSQLWGDCYSEKHLNVMFFCDVQNVKYLRRSPLS